MVVSRRDEAISEVIGFVLILALIAIVASLYLTYVVPAQGRDLEIAHMDVIQNQFLDYKTTVDSLWLNNQYNTQISSPFTLGTNPGSTQGSFVNLPLFQPVTSGGTLVVLDKDSTNFVSDINVTADALYDESPRDIILPKMVQIEPDHLYVSFSTKDNTKEGSVNITPTKGNWKVQLKDSPGPPTPLAITIFRNNIPTLSNIIVQTSIVNNSSYQIDLTNSVYSLKEAFEYPFAVTFSEPPSNIPGLISYEQLLPTEYNMEQNAIIIPTSKMGSLEYHSNNNYWISQNYIYQYGGVFLQQDNGAVVKLLPSITITQDSKNPNLARVTINNITISKTTPSKVGGSSLIEVLTTLKKPDVVSTNLVNPKAYGLPNAKSVKIVINTGDDNRANQMWFNTFEKIRQNSGLPSNWVITNEQSGNIVKMTLSNTNPGYNIVLDVQSSVATISLSPTSYQIY